MKETRKLVVIAHDIRSCHNVGSLLRTAEGLGVDTVWFTGYTPYPGKPNDDRLPHIAAKIDKDINKTALGTQNSVAWETSEDLRSVITKLKRSGYHIIALEQDKRALSLVDYKPGAKTAILLGREVEGIDPEILELCDDIVEIPMLGKKESFNVVQAAAMMLYHCRFSKL